MNKMIAPMLGFILLALHLSSQVQAGLDLLAESKLPPVSNTTMNGTTWTGTTNGTDSGINGTSGGATGASVSVHANTLTVLVSVALTGTSFLHRRV